MDNGNGAYRVFHWGTEPDAMVELRLDSTLSDDLSEIVPQKTIFVSDRYDRVGFDVDTAEQVARDMLAAVERARTA